MTISVFVPFYSRDPVEGLGFLKIAIQSVINQTYKDWTLTLLDDQSPIDGVQELIQSFGDSRISYRRNEKNLGQAGNWNAGIALANTEIYTILHADDEMMPQYLEKMSGFLASRPDAAAAFCNAVIIDEGGREVFSFVDKVKSWIAPIKSEIKLFGDSGLALLLRGNFIMCPTVMYRRPLIGDIVYTDKWKWIPDFTYWTALLLADRTIVGTPEVLFRYRRHSQSGTDVIRKTVKIFEEEKDFYQSIEQRADAKGWPLAAKVAREKSMVKLRTAYFMLKDFAQLDVRASLAKAAFLRTLF